MLSLHRIRLCPRNVDLEQQGAARVNGFSVERWAALETVSQQEAVVEWESFHHSVAQGRTCLFCGYNVCLTQVLPFR